MPIFLDRHDVVEFSAEEVAKLHVKDLEIQDQYGVKFLTYWYDAERRTTFCLVDAPDKEIADRVHAEAHGHVSNQMIAVDLSAVSLSGASTRQNVVRRSASYQHVRNFTPYLPWASKSLTCSLATSSAENSTTS